MVSERISFTEALRNAVKVYLIKTQTVYGFRINCSTINLADQNISFYSSQYYGLKLFG